MAANDWLDALPGALVEMAMNFHEEPPEKWLPSTHVAILWDGGREQFASEGFWRREMRFVAFDSAREKNRCATSVS